MTEELISTLSKTKGLRVIASTSVMRYKGVSKPVAEIGKELNVGNILEGSVRKAGDKIRINVQLVETANEEPKWSQVYEREIKDVFAVQSDIGRRVTDALREQVLGQPAPQAVKTAPASLEAYIEYLRGRQFWNKMTEGGLNEAIDHFQRALALDPNYANAYAGLADSYASMSFLEFISPKAAYPKAKEAVEKSLAINPELAEAHTSKALIKFQHEWDWRNAEEEFQLAIGLNPSYAPAHRFFSDYLKAMGRFDEAVTEINMAYELDPLSLEINTGFGHVLYLSRRYDDAIAQYRRAVELDPGFAKTHIWFGRSYLEKGMYTEALSELELAVKLSGDSTVALAMLGHALAAADRKEEVLQILDRLTAISEKRYVSSYWIAVVYNGMKDREQTLAWLRKAFDERSSWLVWSNVEPRFDWLRSDQEFTALMNAMKIP
jgi:tetratricopeptide (TPR) repeat protein